MIFRNPYLPILLSFLMHSNLQAKADVLHHSIYLSVYPQDKSLKAIDSVFVKIQEPKADGSVDLGFLVNKSLSIESIESNASITNWFTQECFDPTLFTSQPDSAQIETINRSKGLFVSLKDLPDSEPVIISISYMGVLYDSLKPPTPKYPKATPSTSGLIDPQGIYLCNQSVWYPLVFDQHFSFSLSVETPLEWMPISQGRRCFEEIATLGGEQRLITKWVEKNPMEEIYLVAAKFYRYEKYHDGIALMAYLREPEDSLANRYIQATARYISMYEQLIGKYPFEKFALAENFWQTGFGMPSFTLLGDKVIRLPFIVATSYGHEILHNWWGNSVYVDYTKGNWCEGLTTYCADYLYKEMESLEAARAYRHNTLISYTNNVRSDNDFPLARFRERYDAASQSIGYGKSLMVFHMLRKQIGDTLFWQGLRNFYNDFNFRTASWDDLAKTFSQIAGKDCSWFFDQWVKRQGAPSLRIAHADWRQVEAGFVLDLTLAQDEPPFVLDVPVVVVTDHGEESFNVKLLNSKQDFSLKLRARPILLKVDPDYDLMRRLDIEEIPMTIGGLFAQESTIAILGNGLNQQEKDKMRMVAKQWGLEARVYDEESVTRELIDNRSVWFLGPGKLARNAIENAGHRLKISDQSIIIDGKSWELADGTLIVTVRNPVEKALGIGIVLTQDVDGFTAVASRVPHYSTYSYLGFRNSRLELKGAWSQDKSPLVIDFSQR